MVKTILIVGIGGFIGSAARFLTAKGVAAVVPTTFPFGTLAANIFGCLIIGIIYGLSQKYGWLTPEWRFFLATGFCGGYTTFSSFAYENVNMLQTGNYWPFMFYILTSVIVGITAVFVGLKLIQ